MGMGRAVFTQGPGREQTSTDTYFLRPLVNPNNTPAEIQTPLMPGTLIRERSPVYAMKPATFNLIFHIIKVVPGVWELGIQKDIDWRFLKM